MPRPKEVMAREYAARTARAKAEGFTGYPQERRAKVEISKEYTRLAEKGIGVGPPPPGSPVQKAMLEAKAIIMGYSKKTVERADQQEKSLLARTKKGRLVRDKLRAALGYKDRKWATYYPSMRALYTGKRRRG